MTFVGRCSAFRTFGTILLLVCLYGLHIAWEQRAFEHYLKSVSITLNDFPADYSNAVIDSYEGKQQFQYDDYATFPSLDPNSTIPPVIHFIWFKDLYNAHLDVSTIPTTGSQAPEVCQYYNPDFKVNVWNETAGRLLIAQHYPWFLPTYDGYKHPIQRVDAFKYFVVWHFGGIYIDLDINCRRSLFPITQFPAWFPKTGFLGVNNDAFAARKHHPIIGEMTKRLKSRDWNLLFPYLTIYWSSGPLFASDVLKSWFQLHQENSTSMSTVNERDPSGFYVLPLQLYSEEYTFFGHRAGGTWHGWDVAIVLFLVGHPWTLVLFIGSLSSCALMCWMRWRMRRKRGAYTRANADESG